MRLFVLLLTATLSLPFTTARFHPEEDHPQARATFGDSDFAAANWIWLPEPSLQTTAPPGTVGFFRTFTSPSGKTAGAASIALTADNNFTVWVNGQPIGASNPTDTWASGQALIASLNATTNTITALAVNYDDASTAGGATPAGFLAFVRVFYTDGSNSTFATDTSWKAIGTIPSDWPLPADTSKFVNAEVVFKYGGGPWGTSVTVTESDLTTNDLTGSNWIWSTPDAATSALAGSVGFRKTIASPSDKTASSATVIASADNTFALYVNGRYVSSPPHDPNTPNEALAGWQYASRVTTSLAGHGSSNTFDLYATNFLSSTSDSGSSAGLIAIIQITYTDGTSTIVRTDTTWLAAQADSPSAFLGMADSALSAAASLGLYGMAPWGNLGNADTVDVNRIFFSGNNVGSGAPISASSPTTTKPSTTTNLPAQSFTFTGLGDTTSSDSSPAQPTNAGVLSVSVDGLVVTLGSIMLAFCFLL
ncbi:hypothetical protein C8F01DRAFT_513184 [Mycena amicta]|nr:hypothetical protein C8F01DRAFT_513184 [Mycena amicta]